MVFSLFVLWWRRIRGLQKLPDGMIGALLSKSLIQFSVDGWSCVPSLLFTWDQTMVEVIKITATSFKMSHACTATLSAPTLQQATTDPPFHWRLLDTPGQVWAVSCGVGNCSFSWVLVCTSFYKQKQNSLDSLFLFMVCWYFCICISVASYLKACGART